MGNTKAKFIFTDCFNTLIGRKKTPNDVLLDWGKKMNASFPQIEGIDFFKMFKKSWETIHQRDIVQIENSEFLTDISEIFESIKEDISKYNLINDFDKNNFIKICFNNYIEAEHESHYIKQKTLNYLIKWKYNNARIFMVSDFYCSASVLHEWLDRVGIDVDFLFEKIYVSSDLKKSKATGSIYKHIIEENHLNPKDITMIGDNIISDIKKARKMGLRTKLIAMPQIKRDNKEIRKSKTKLNIPKIYQNIFEKYSKSNGYYTNYAFPLFAFTKRLFEECQRKKIKNLFFLAREGKFLKKLFDEYCSFYKYDIKTHYFVVSRASVIATSIKPYEIALRGLYNKYFISTKAFLKTLNFTEEQINNISKKLKVNVKGIAFFLQYSRPYKKVIRSQEFKDIFDNKRQEQRENYTRYLKSFNVDIEKEGFYIVDSGWMGNMQRYLANYFNYPQHIEGFYVGTGFKKCTENKTYGLLFNSKKKTRCYLEKIFSYRRLNYEEILRAEESSCLMYGKDGVPMLGANSKERQGYVENIKPIQDLIFEKFKMIVEFDSKNYSDIYSICAFMNYQMIKKSGRVDREFFNNAQDTFRDSFGYIGFSYVHISKFLRKLNFQTRDFLYIIKNRHLIKKRRLFWL